MFTGHIRELGLIESFDGAQVRVRAPQTAAAVEPGGSVCVSGIRLTVPEVTGAVLAGHDRHRDPAPIYLRFP